MSGDVIAVIADRRVGRDETGPGGRLILDRRARVGRTRKWEMLRDGRMMPQVSDSGVFFYLGAVPNVVWTGRYKTANQM